MRAMLVVSDPWELADSGEIPATVLSWSDELAILRLDTSLQIAGIPFDRAECRPRHVGVTLADDSVMRAVNVAFIPVDVGSLESGAPHAIGTLQFGQDLRSVR